MRTSHSVVAVLTLLVGGCGGGTPDSPGEPLTLGPVDGFDLPAVDTGRVGVGDPAPDFALATFRGDTVTLSEFRGEREVLLVFYRGSW